MYISGSCNLRCRHCWIDPEYREKDYSSSMYVDPAAVEKTVREALPLGLRTVKLTGGEPLMHPGFPEIFDFLSKAGLEIQIETNGTLIDKAMAELIGACRGSVHAAVSFDGSTPAQHDAFRRVPGSFDRALRGTGLLVEAGVRPQMISTLYRGNVTEVDRLVELAEHLGCGSLKLNLVIRSGRGSEMGADAFLTVPEVLDLNRRIEVEIIPSTGIRVLLGVPMAFHTLARLLRPEAVKCTLRNIAGLLPGGEIALCGIGSLVTELVYGNILEEDLETIWSDSPGLAALRQTIPSQLEGVCSLCLHRDVCQGFCVAMNYLESGKLNSDCSFCREANEMGLFPETRKC
jgi:SynChlorMet cassette radical SAM/SPASM protein ScmF